MAEQTTALETVPVAENILQYAGLQKITIEKHDRNLQD